MKSIGELISQANAEETRAIEKPSEISVEPRLHRVTLCVMMFAQSEVMALSAHEAVRIAESDPKFAKRTFQTVPAAHRIEIQRRKDPRNLASPLEWVEIAKPGT